MALAKFCRVSEHNYDKTLHLEKVMMIKVTPVAHVCSSVRVIKHC